jgi:hypothetical protein
VQVKAVDPVSFQAILTVPEGIELPVFDRESTTHPLLRRWDQKSDVLPVQEAKWIDLEDGVQVYFEPGGTYRTGDYWLIPARTATGDVLWPVEEDDDGTTSPKAVPPHGIKHHYAPLARIAVDGNGGVTCEVDCRCTFAPLCSRVDAAESIDEQKLAELRKIKGLGAKRAEAMLASGHDTPRAVAAMTIEEIKSLLEVSDAAAQMIKASALDIAERRD